MTLFGKNKGEGKQTSPSKPADNATAENVGEVKNAAEELKIDKDFKVYTDSKSSELVEVINVATGKQVTIARIHVARLVKAGLVTEV